VKFIVGFNRDRDGYEVPGALAEEGLLSTLVTDYYHGRSTPRLGWLSHRNSPRIPVSDVRPVPGALIPQLRYEAMKRLGLRSAFPSNVVNDRLAKVLARESAQRPENGLLIYSNYAWCAFRQAATETRILFQYHPNVHVISEAMGLDELGDRENWQRELEEVDDKRKFKEGVEVEFATGAICASTFTARGLIMSGIPAERIRVVPYGCPSPTTAVSQQRDRVFLFVGQGVQRKGLHLLAEAWRRLQPPGWKMRVVASRMDPLIAQSLHGLPSVTVSGPVSHAELRDLYDSASALVLPSLVEGFGLVLGEALAGGCSLIATTNTGLPDLALPSPAGQVIQPGSIAELMAAIESHISAFEDGQVDPQANSRMAAQRSWREFRVGIRDALNKLT